MLVHVLNKHGKPLMPCSPRKARILLKQGKARPAKGRTGHFTIQLIYGSSGYKQPVSVGVDLGETVGIAAVTGNKVLYAKEKILRSDVKKQLSDRASYRRNRRTRKTRYRKPRFDNRVKTKCARCGVNNVPKVWKKKKRKNGKSLKNVSNGRAELCRKCQGKKGLHKKPHILPPSVRSRAEGIIRDIENLAKSLPLTRVTVEVASFDTQKMANALIQGVEYQQGTLFGYEVKQYLLTVYKHRCAYCGGLSGDNILEIDHLTPKSKGGTDKISNLTIACKTCNDAKGSLTLEQWRRSLQDGRSQMDNRRVKGIERQKKRRELKRGFQYSALTQSYKNYLLAELRGRFPVSTTYGAKTKFDRLRLGIDKSHVNDALVIASDGEPLQVPDFHILEKQIKKRRPAEFISPPVKGRPVVKRKWEHEIFGFRLWDRVSFTDAAGEVVQGYVTARRLSGSFRVGTLDGREVTGGKSYRKLTLVKPCVSNYQSVVNGPTRSG